MHLAVEQISWNEGIPCDNTPPPKFSFTPSVHIPLSTVILATQYTEVEKRAIVDLQVPYLEIHRWTQMLYMQMAIQVR